MKKHVAYWKALGKLLQNHCQDVLLTQEWPKTCGLWKEETYQRVKKSLGLSFGREVDRCSFDLVYKRWWFACNRSEWCEIFSGKLCDKNHGHVAPESLEATGFYPTKLGNWFLPHEARSTPELTSKSPTLEAWISPSFKDKRR
eukprot:s3490_g15.t1